MMMATAPMGTLTKKIQRHPMALVMAPPTSGPTATAPPVTAPKIPKAVPRSFPWKAWAIRASEVANMMAPPTPCTARDRFSMSESVERPQVSEARENTASPTAKTIAAPEHVADHPGGEQEGGQGQGIGVDDPLQVRKTRMERPLDVGQGHVDDRDVEQQHENGGADRDERPPLAFERRHLGSVSRV